MLTTAMEALGKVYLLSPLNLPPKPTITSHVLLSQSTALSTLILSLFTRPVLRIIMR